jgi:soluble lytic murein transglycosylase-like protein
MKFAAIALLLGSAAILCGLAVQSGFFHLETRLTLVRRWLTFRHAAPKPVSAPLSAVEDGTVAPAIPLLSKAETLILIAGAAAKHGVPAAFVSSIVAAESNFNSTAISPKGAIGLMQLMPETAQQFGANPAVPAENIDAGTRYLGWLMKRYEKRRNSIRHVIAAYNAGPGMVDRYRGVPPFRETRHYVTRVLGFLKQFSPSQPPGGRRAHDYLRQSVIARR